jgi:hypothetical protein
MVLTENTDLSCVNGLESRTARNWQCNPWVLWILRGVPSQVLNDVVPVEVIPAAGSLPD